VSVVIIFLDAERFIREAIESVFAQTYEAWELLLVDDGSTDGSTEIARRLAEQHPDRVRYLQHPGHRNRGMSASRNLGIRNSAGRFVAFLDADDVWMPQKLAEQVAILEARPDAAMVYGPAEYWHGWTGEPADAERDFVQSVGAVTNRVILGMPLLSQFVEREGTTPSPSGVLVRRSVLDAIGGFEESFTGLYEDQAFYAKACLSHAAYVSDRVWYRYRQHENGACAAAACANNTRQARRTYLRWLETTLRRADRGSQPVALQVRRALVACHASPVRASILARKWAGIRSRLRDIARALGARTRRTGVQWGSLRRLEPVSRRFGADRGQCVDRCYIERFLSRHADDVRGRVLEVGSDTYTRRFGGDRVARADVLHAETGKARATFVANLANATSLPSDAFDCVILTQTLHLIDDAPAALRTAHRILKPGGVVLATLPGISQVSRYDMERWGDRWRFTTLSARELFERAFTDGRLTVTSCGNVLTATAFLHGISADELTPGELEHHDADYPLIITVRAEKTT
jgi:glycosyltransferase involved in cell wall biosynthesis/SAM-dependent methyltransferase